MTPGDLAGQGLEVVTVHGVPEPGDDTEGERVAADTGEMLAQQVNCPAGLSGRRGGDHLDLVAFPGRRPAGRVVGRSTGEGTKIGGGQVEARVGADRQVQCRGGPVRIAGFLRLLGQGGRAPGGGDRPAVDLSRGPGSGQPVTGASVLIWRWLHGFQAARPA